MTKRNQQPIPNATKDVQKDVDQLASASADPVTVELGQYTFTVRPLKMRQVFPFLKLIRPIFATLSSAPVSTGAGLPPAGATPGQGGTPNKAQAAAQGAEAIPPHVQNVLSDGDWIMSVLEDHGPSVLKALACALDTNNNPDAQAQLLQQFDDLELVSVLVLVKHVVVVNSGFFVAQGLTLGRNGGLGGLLTR